MAAAAAVQEPVLRDLAASGGCPALTRAVAQRHPGTAAADLAYQQLLGALRNLPVTTYDGELAASCNALLAAMRSGDGGKAAQLAAAVCGEAPVDWHMTSGTTGSSKHFPATALSTARAMTASGRSSWQLQLAKFPLPAPGGESSGSEVPTRHRNLSLALAGPCEELPGGQLVGSVSSVWLTRASRQGVVVDRDGQGRSMACTPPGLTHLLPSTNAAGKGASAAARYYALWLCAAADPGLPGITFLSDLFAGNLLTAISVLQHSWRDMVADLTAGEVGRSVAGELPPAAVDSVNAYLAAAGHGAAAASARHISAVMAAWQQQQQQQQRQQQQQQRQQQQQQQAAASKAGDGEAPPPAPLLGQLMPNLQAVSVIVTGTHGKFWPALQALLSPHVAVCTPMYAGTEGLYAITEQLLREGPYDTATAPPAQRFLMLPHGNCFFEFLPVEPEEAPEPQQAAAGGDCAACNGAHDGVVQQHGQQPGEQQQQQQTALTLDELQPGRSYELLVTTFSGLPRYLVGDVVRVEGYVRYDPAACRIVDERRQQAAADSAGAGQQDALRVPLITFQGRRGVALNLIWEKFDEGQLLQALRDTDAALRAQQAGPAAFPGLAEWTVYESHADEGDKHYRFLWELQPQPAAARSEHRASASASADAAAWARVLNAQLGLQNSVYAGLLSAGQVGPARITLVAPGSFAALKDAQVLAKGISPSQYKTPSVVQPNSWAAGFLQQRAL